MNQELETNNSRVRNNEENVREIDLLDLFGFYFSRILWIVIVVFAGALISGLITKFAITPKYTATSTMYMVSSSSGSVVDLSDLNIGTSISNDYMELIKTRPIIESVIDDQHLDYTYDEVLGMLNISVLNNTRILKISVTNEDPEIAMRIANDLAVKTEMQIPILMDTPKPSIAEQAVLPETPSSPSLTRNVLLAAVICLVVMLIILTVMYLMDDSVKTAEDVEKYFGVVPLTTIPEGKIEGLDNEEENAGTKGKNNNKKKKRSA